MEGNFVGNKHTKNRNRAFSWREVTLHHFEVTTPIIEGRKRAHFFIGGHKGSLIFLLPSARF